MPYCLHATSSQQKCGPVMPLAPNKPYCYNPDCPDGTREELPVSPVLTPEKNLQELMQGGATHMS